MPWEEFPQQWAQALDKPEPALSSLPKLFKSFFSGGAPEQSADNAHKVDTSRQRQRSVSTSNKTRRNAGAPSQASSSLHVDHTSPVNGRQQSIHRRSPNANSEDRSRSSEVAGSSKAGKSRSPSASRQQDHTDKAEARRQREDSSKSQQSRRPIRLSTFGPGAITRDLVASTSSTNINVGRQMPIITTPTLNMSSGDGAYSPASPTMMSDVMPHAFPHSHSFYPSYHNFSNIPGFPLSKDIINDDAMSVSSMGTHHHFSTRNPQLSSASDLAASQIFRRLRGEGLSREYWMPDEMSKQCRDCGSVFTALRRKHHCRVCGQIFCSTCASNIISGTRFGHKGFVRTCNDCLAKMDNEILHPRRGSAEDLIAGSTNHKRFPTPPSLPSRNPSVRPNISVPLESQYKGPQSQFAASVLFPRSSEFPAAAYDDDNEYEDDLQSRPDTPNDLFDYEDGTGPLGLASPLRLSYSYEDKDTNAFPQCAPFRKHLSEDDAEMEGLCIPVDEHNSSMPLFASSSEAGNMQALLIEAEEAVAGSTLAPDPHALHSVAKENPALLDKEQSPSSVRPLTPSSSASLHLYAATKLGGRPRRSSRTGAETISSADEATLHRSDSASLRRAIINNTGNERPRRDSLPGMDQDLVSVNFSFIRALLRQCLVQDEVPDIAAWESCLMIMLARVTRSVKHDRRISNEMDIRRFIKIKKLPGGRPTDTNYIDGIAFTKNIPHKGMLRTRSSPRIMLLAYPIEYQHSTGQFMSLDPLISQEKDYLEKLVKRIASFRPHLVLTEQGVSQIALRFFLDHKITVIKHVKPSIMQSISRCTGSDIIYSMDQLLTQPAIGRCGRFRAETFDHRLIPGRRKTLLRIEGCSAELGATIILRGADIDTLTRVKKTMRFMILVANSLRMESFLFYDEHTSVLRLPKATYDLPEDIQRQILAQSEDAKDQTARAIVAAIRPYTETILSSSPFTAFPPPQPIYQALEDDLRLRRLKIAREDEEVALIIREEQESALSRRPSQADTTIITSNDDETSVISESDISSIRAPSGIAQPPQLGSRTGSYLQAAVSSNQQPIAIDSLAVQLEEAEDTHADRLAMYDMYRLRHVNSLDPRDHQKLMVLCSVVNSATLKTCVNPELRLMHYYGQGDETLGNFIESYVAEANKFCPLASCSQACLLHYKIFVHGSRRVTAILEQFPCPVAGGQDRIYLWSYCKECESPAKHTVMSEQTWSYSFAHYLELSFYPGQLGCKTILPNCTHNIHRDHVRYFSYKNLAVRIYSDDVDTFAVFQPPLRLKRRKQLAIALRNEEYKSIVLKHEAYWNSLKHRLRSFNFECVHADKVELARAQLEEYSKRVDADRKSITALLEDKHKEGRWSSGIVLNAARRAMQDKIVEWDSEFASFEAKFAASDRDRDLRRLTGYQLKRLFVDSSNPGSPEHKSISGFSTPPNEEKGSTISDLSDLGEANDEKAAGEAVLKMEMPALEGNISTGAVSELSESNLAKLLSTTPGTISMPDQPPATSLTSMDLNASENTAGHGKVMAETDGNSVDSDSTICAEPPLTSMQRLALPEHSESEDVLTSDVDCASQRPQYHTPVRRSGRPIVVADLVKRFDGSSDRAPPSVDNEKTESKSKDPSESAMPRNRPSLRRGKSDMTSKSVHKQRSSAHLHDGVLSDPEADTNMIKTLSQISNSRKGKRPASLKLVKDDAAKPSTPSAQQLTSDGPSKPLTLTRPVNFSRRSTLKSTAKLPSKVNSPKVNDYPHKSLSTGPQPPTKQGPSVQLQGRLAAQRRVASANHMGSKVSTIARHFDRLTREAERDRQRRLAVMRVKRARPVASAKPTISVYTSAKEALREDSDNESGQDGSAGSADDEYDEEEESHHPKQAELPKTAVVPSAGKNMPDAGKSDQLSRNPSIAESYIYDEPFSNVASSQSAEIDGLPASLPLAYEHPKLPLIDEKRVVSDTNSNISAPVSPTVASSVSASLARASHMSESEMSSSGTDRNSLMRTITSLWTFRGCEFAPLQYPLSSSEHVFMNNPIIVREDEPSSIIAFALASRAYKDKLKEAEHAPRIHEAEAFMPQEDGGAHGHDKVSNWGVVDMPDIPDLEEQLKRPQVQHFRLQFEEGSCKFSCKVFFAEQFDALRHKCGCEESFIDSLARCVQWDASGGKSGSAFLKTRDDRFIIKEISRLEMDAFLRFAPAYFDYMTRAFFHTLPTLLAKVLGFFRLSFNSNGKSTRMDVLVMENLFYDRSVSKIYDLKGSKRNRHVVTTGKRGEVLLDENLTEMAYKSPLFVTEQSKKLLRMSLFNDTLFLEKLNVMDYSLVVGLDTTRGELVVGIVDFIRTYTWDKKVENWVKGTGRVEPTVVTPKLYKNRLRNATEEYFLLCPDKWTSVEAMLRPKEATLKDATGTEDNQNGKK